MAGALTAWHRNRIKPWPALQPTGVYREAADFVWFRGQAVSVPVHVTPQFSASASQRLYKSLELLDLLFSKSLTARERLDIMEKKFNITLTEELEGYCEYCYS